MNRLTENQSKWATRIASWLPRWLVYFAVVRMWAYVWGRFDVDASKVTVPDMLELWDKGAVTTD